MFPDVSLTHLCRWHLCSLKVEREFELLHMLPDYKWQGVRKPLALNKQKTGRRKTAIDGSQSWQSSSRSLNELTRFQWITSEIQEWNDQSNKGLPRSGRYQSVLVTDWSDANTIKMVKMIKYTGRETHIEHGRVWRESQWPRAIENFFQQPSLQFSFLEFFSHVHLPSTECQSAHPSVTYIYT